jgi:hypothetical protein
MADTSPVDLGIDYLAYQHHLKMEKRGSKNYVWDIIRKKYIQLQPEEFVRQLLLHWLIYENGISKNLIGLEKQFKVNQLVKRFDLVIYDKDGSPLLLAECKSHREPLNQNVFDQISVYFHTIKAPYLLLTNGLVTYLASKDSASQTYIFESTPEKIRNFR